MTLFVFFLRYFVFSFHESPKFLLSKGREQEAIDVLHKIAKFNRAPPPTLTVEHFREIESASSEYSQDVGPVSHTRMVARVLKGTVNSFKHLKGLFFNKLQLFIFCILAVAYMVCSEFLKFLLWGIALIVTGRLLVLQFGRLIPPHHPAPEQR